MIALLPKGRVRVGVLCTLGLCLVALWAHAYSYSFVSDDAYISFRYAYNFAVHGELVFNLGDPVEGYTNFLWTVLLGLLFKAGLPMAQTSQVLGALCGGAVVLLLFVLSRLYRGGKMTPWELLGALLLPATGGFAVWCSGGLETQLFAALVLGGITAYVAESGGQLRHPLSAGIFALAAMTRPEGLFFFAVTGAHRLGSNILGDGLPGFRRWLPKSSDWAWLVAFALPFGAFFLWRYDYYGYPFPNTYYVKAGGDAWHMFQKWGLPYLWDFIHLNRLYVLAPFLLLLWPKTTWRRGLKRPLQAADEHPAPFEGPGWLEQERSGQQRFGQQSGQMLDERDRSDDQESVAAAAVGAEGESVRGADASENGPGEMGALEHAPAEAPLNSEHPPARIRPAFLWSYLALLVIPFMAYVCLVGGDFMAMGRFFLPVLPLILLAGQEGLRETFERPRRAPDAWRASRFFPVAVVLLGLFIVNSIWLHRENRKMRYHRWGLDTVGYLRKFADDRILVGQWLRKHVPKNTYISVGGAGAIVYASRLKALDTFGLNDSWIAHKGPRRGDRPGHSKFAPDHYVRSQKPDLMCHRGHHQDWPYRPSPQEAKSWRRQGYKWVCIDPPGMRPSYYCCLKRLDRDLGVWPAEGSGAKNK